MSKIGEVTGMHVEVRRLDHRGDDVGDWAAAYRNLLAGDDADSVDDLVRRARSDPPDGDAARFAAYGEGGSIIGAALVRTDGPAAAYARLYVRPEFRRRRVGRALADACADWTAGRGRTEVRSVVYAGRPDEAFASALGATVLIRLVTVARSLDRPAPAVPAPPGLTLIRWTARAPEEHLADYAALKRAVGDAPDATQQIDVAARTVEAIREWERRCRDRLWVTGAQDGSRLVAFTEVEVPSGGEASQHDTAVAREYRSRGVATWIKADMIDRIRSARPDVLDITSTVNLRNAPMLAVWDRLGARRVAERRLVGRPVGHGSDPPRRTLDG